MPSIPLYNQGATDDLNRAKRRVVQAEKAGIATLTTKPAVDMTKGEADNLADLIIKNIENLITSLDNLIVVESVNPEDINMEVMLQQARGAILVTRQTRRLLRLSKQFASVIQFTDLDKIADLRALLEELGNPLVEGTLTNRYFTIAVNKIGDALERMNDEERSQYSNATGSIVSELSSELGDDDDDDMSELSLFSGDEDQSKTWSELSRRRAEMEAINPRIREMNDARRLVRDLARQMGQARGDDDDDDGSSSYGSTLNPASVRSRESRARRQQGVKRAKFSPTDYLSVLQKFRDNLVDIFKTFNDAFYNFNEFRQQRLPPDEEKARDANDREVFEGRGRMKPVYSVGNKVLDAMYKIEGLPKFL